MMYFYYLLFLVGLVFYVLALISTNGATRECYSDVGNGLMLIAAVMLLIRIAWRLQRAGSTPK
jgi:hypothetical protein